MAARTATAPGAPTTKLGKAAYELDDRIIVAPWLRRTLNKVYPDHWSFLLGEIALYSFIILLLSGTYLTFFFDASMREVVYDGSYAPLRGVEMSAAYDSALRLSFDVRGGLFMRQLHHWAALLFVAAIVVHLLRIFFTGAFRRPRETNWIIGVIMLVLALLMGVTGYSLPDDLLSGTGLRIISAILLSVPVIGTWAHFAVFNGDYVGEQIIGRFYIVHVLLIPAILLALIGLHLLILVKQKHTQFPGAGPHRAQRRRQPALPDVRGEGDRPGLRGLRRLRPARRPRADQPDLAVGPVQPGAGVRRPRSPTGTSGSSTARPASSRRGTSTCPASYTIPALFWPTVVIAGAMFTVLALYPIIERKLTGDTASHHLLQRPRDVPVRTALGAMGLSFYVWLWMSGGNDVIADKFDISLNAMTWVGRIGVVILPPIAYVAHLPDLPRSAAARPRGARARHRDRRHPAAAQRRVHRGAPAPRPGRRPRPRHARLRRCAGARSG